MKLPDEAADIFRSGTEHTTRNNVLLIGAAVVADVVAFVERPDLLEFEWLGLCLVAVPALGRIVDGRKLTAQAEHEQI